MSTEVCGLSGYISGNKEILDILPKNNKSNLSKYMAKVEELEIEALDYKKQILAELKDRYKKTIKKSENPIIEELYNNIMHIESLELSGKISNPLKKIGLDRIIHNLSSFYEGNLEMVNQNLVKTIQIFRKLEIELDIKDFDYSSYVEDYMIVFFDELNDDPINSERIKQTFEKIYWKCPDIVTHLELNVRHIYYKNEKRISKHLKTNEDNLLKIEKTTKKKLFKKLKELKKELEDSRQKDQKLLMDRFLNKELDIKNYLPDAIKATYGTFLKDIDIEEVSDEHRIEINENFKKLLNTLYEYRIYSNFKYIIEDLTKRYFTEQDYENVYKTKNKELRKKEDKLFALNNKRKRLLKEITWIEFLKKFNYAKIKKLPITVKNNIRELKKDYDELDKAFFNSEVKKILREDASVLDVLELSTYFYDYLYSQITKNNEDADVDEEIEKLEKFIKHADKTMLKNLKIIEKNNVEQIITQRYNLVNIEIEEEDLADIDSLIEKIQIIVDYYNLQQSGMKIDDLVFLENAGKILSKNETKEEQ